MGRGRGKGKKLTVVSHEDEGSSEEEKIPVQKRRGRPQKPLKDDTDEDESEKIEEGDSDNKDTTLSAKEMNQKTVRKRNQAAKEKSSLVTEENGGDTKPSAADDLANPGIRSSGKRRKGTPHRAAESGVPFGY